MKPLHAGWLIDACNKLSSCDGKSVILSGWEAAGITDALEQGLAVFSRVIPDPYSDIDPFDQGDIDFNMMMVTVPLEEYVEKERVVNEDFDDEYIPIAHAEEDETE